MEELLQREASYAEQNAKRFRLVGEAFRQKGFEVIVNIVDLLVAPLDTAMNRLLKRTSTLKALRFWHQSCDKTVWELKTESRTFFLSYQDGSFGTSILRDFSNLMQTGQLAEYCATSPDCSMLRTSFELLVFAFSDSWRRFCLPSQSFPQRLFSLATCDEQSFAEAWAEFRDIMTSCPDCVDAAFTSPLLRSANMTELTNEDLEACVQGIQSMLCELATFCPSATDLVENLHGQHQDQFHKFRGKSKAPETAAECSVLANLKNEHAYLKSTIMGETLPSRSQLANMDRNLGRKKGVMPRESRRTRLLTAARKSHQPITGWNVFQKEQLQRHSSSGSGGRPLSMDEYADVQKECSRQWKRMTEDQKSRALDYTSRRCHTHTITLEPIVLCGACSEHIYTYVGQWVYVDAVVRI